MFAKSSARIVMYEPWATQRGDTKKPVNKNPYIFNYVMGWRFGLF